MLQPWHSSLTIDEIQKMLESEKYVAERSIAIAIFLALKLNKPLLIEGEPGSGKTEIAKVISKMLGTDLIRLQCYEGLDASSTLYEWDYLRQLLKIRLEEGRKESDQIELEIFNEKYLLKRPLLKALLHDGDKPPILLMDEIDRADEEFEGFLLEFLAEFQVTIPEMGTISAKHHPIVLITSNRTRELGDGLRRRCLYLYLDYPSLEKELKIINLKIPQISQDMAKVISRFVQKLRSFDDIIRKPGMAETLDWGSALVTLGQNKFDGSTVNQTIGCLIKSADDLERLDRNRVEEILKSIT